jgi:SAM-dependent methyltransferase
MAGRQRDSGAPPVRRIGQPAAVELLADPDRPRAWTLLVGSTPQSYVDLDEPRHLEFEYVLRIGHLLDLARPDGVPLRVLHLGGGALTLARYVAATRPGSTQLAVDDDADLVDLVRERLPLRQPGRRHAGRGAGRIRIRVADARAVLGELPGASFDVVIADLFAGARTPAHLTSIEFTAAVHRVLAPGGLFAANIGDGPPLAHTRRRVATVRAGFASAALISDAAVLRGRRFGNLVLAASDTDLPEAELTRLLAGDPFPARLVHGDELDTFAAGAPPITDAQAELSPVPPPGVFAP